MPEIDSPAADDPAGDASAVMAAWSLQADGQEYARTRAYVAPVRTSDGQAATLKIAAPGPGTAHEHLVLRRWDGHGAVRLLRADPHRRAILVERAGRDDLTAAPDRRACEIVAQLYRRLHVPAMPQLSSLTEDVRRRTLALADLPRSAPLPRRLVEQAITLGRELTVEPAERVVLHGNLHYRNALAADREPWLAISPRPCNGDPPYELAPMLWHRFDDLAGNVRDGVRQRFHRLVDGAGFDEDRARAWTLVRVVHAAADDLRTEPASATTQLTRYVAIAKAIQD
ncbi:aminoglycoside phosphotransferase family protein [Mycolicibacterium sp. PAM1]|uniref:aminoglycoside phosphotransferase family protein n=1 Tax=Mycolicibacterium sp. PAM1 TaxID=2853535 RepID=UPI0002FBE2EE|nr:aminoglycoside phosphotransferase family protein [Mycolicibacterium sp. PAM1]MBV5244986.1 aminoglycoside phosphotransferase family protein [Mycolicibacterium sp. PAM1]